MIILLGVRSWQHYRATGTAGFNGFRRARGAAARLAGAGFVLALLAGALAPILIWLDMVPVIWPASDLSLITLVTTRVEGLEEFFGVGWDGGCGRGDGSAADNDGGA